MVKENVVYPNLSYLITGLLFKVHNALGRYRNEKQYGDYLEKIFKEKGVLYQRETVLQKSFEGEKINRNIPDFIVENKIIIDLKAKRIITRDDYFQMKRYLTSANKRLGIIVNFQQKYLTPKRVLNPQVNS